MVRGRTGACADAVTAGGRFVQEATSVRRQTRTSAGNERGFTREDVNGIRGR